MKRAAANNSLFNDMIEYMKHRWHHDGVIRDVLIRETSKKFNVVQGFAKAVLSLVRIRH